MAAAHDVDLGATQASGSATSIALTTGAAVAAGGTIFIGVIVIGTTLTSVTDGTNTYTLLGPETDVSSIKSYLAYAPCPAGLASSSTITANFAGAGTNRMIAGLSATGLVTSSLQDGSTGTRNANNETAYTGASVTTAQAGSFMVALDETNGAGNPTAGSPGAGWAVAEGASGTPWGFGAGGGQLSAALLWQVLGAAGANASSATWSSSQAGGVGGHLAAAFKASTAVFVPEIVTYG